MRFVAGKLSVSRLIVSIATLILLGLTSAAWAQLPTASIRGIVSDVQGGRLPGVTVAATSAATGVPRATVTNDLGSYSILNLAPGLYEVTFRLDGFATTDFPDVRVEVGQERTLDVTMELASVQQTVTVTGGGAGVQLTESKVQGLVTAETVENIPLNGRNFLELAFLVPGNRPATNYDPTKTNTLEVSSAGSFGRGGNITIDGGDNNDEVVGGTLMNLPQDAVQEFQIATNRFTAEVGRSGSSIINIVTKSGGNAIHGSAFAFFRDDALQGLPATFDRSGEEPPFDRQQLGFSVGGPFRKDKAWWFVALENRNQDGEVETGLRDSAAQRVVTSSAAAPLDDFLVSGRVDLNVTDVDDLAFRYSFNRSEEVANGSLAQPLGSAANRQSSFNRFNSFLANWNHQVSNNALNSFTFHFNRFLNSIPEFPDNRPVTDPDLGLTNELRFPTVQDGANFRIPQRTRFDRVQVRDNFSWSKGNHTLAFGLEFQRQFSDALFDLFGSGTVILTENFATQDRNQDGAVNDLDIPIAASIISAAPVRPPFVPDIDNSYFGFYVQDDWRPRPNLTFNLGLRYEFDTNIFGIGGAHQPCPDISQPSPIPCVWLAGVLGLERNRGLDNWGPRVGFAWDPFQNRKTVIRGGYGIYYDRVVLEVRLLELLLDGRILALDVVGGSTLDANGNFLPDAITGQVVNLANPFAGPTAAVPLGINVIDNATAHPYVQQFSLGIQHQFGTDWVLSVDGVHNFGQRQLIGRLLRDQNVNLVTVTDPLTGRTDNIVNIEPSAKSWYDGLLFSLRKRPSQWRGMTYGFNVNYTLSKTLTYFDDDQIPFNVGGQIDLLLGVNNLALEKGYGLTDERHRLSFYGQFDFPWRIRVSPIWTLASDVPGNLFVPQLNTRLPLLARNALGRSVRTGAELNEVIQAWNAAGPTIGPTLPLVNPNLRFGDTFNAFDLRLSKTIGGDRHRVELIGEVFNLFNITNIRGFNNNNYFGFSTALGADLGAPLRTAGGFFGSGGPRAFQLAVRYQF